MVVWLQAMLASVVIAADDQVDELYRLDRLDEFALSVVNIMPSSVVQAMETQGVPPDIIATARTIAEDSFLVSGLQSRLEKELRAGLSEADLSAILAWRKTALGEKIHAAESQHGDAEYAENLRVYSVSKELYSVSDERRLMIIELYGAMNAVDQAAKMIINANYAMALATAIATGEDDPDDATMREVYDGIAASRPQIEIGVRGRMLVTGLYAYRQISDEDLADYMAFNRSEAGMRYNQILFTVVDSWLFDSTKRFGYHFGKALREYNEQQPS